VAVRRLLDQQRPLPHVCPAQRLRLLRPQPGVGEQGDQGGVPRAVPAALRRHGPQLLDGAWRQRAHLAIPPDLRLLDALDRVVRDPPPFDSAAEDALEQHHRPVDRGPPHPVGFEVGAKALDDLRRDRAEPQRSEARQDVPIPEAGVAAQRSRRQVRNGIELPPLLRELGQRFPPTCEQVEVAGPLAPHDLGVKGFGVPLAADDLRPRLSLVVAPADSPDDAALALDSLDAHRSTSDPAPASWSFARKLPRGSVLSTRGGGAVKRRGGETSPAPIHRSSSAGWIRKRLQSRDAASSPLEIAR